MNRRDFLLLRTDANRASVTLSCEQLYMRYVDAELDGSESALFADLDRDLRDATTLRLTDTAWLARRDLKLQLDAVIIAFRKRGGRVEAS